MVPRERGGPRRSRTIAATEFKSHCLALMDEVQRTGDEIVITKHGRPVARLVAPLDKLPSTYGMMRGTLTLIGDPIEPEDVWALDASIFPED